MENNFKDEYTVVGLMSGTSLDGLDIALCRFTKNDKWRYNVIAAETLPYNVEIKSRLERATNMSAYEFVKLDVDLSRDIADKINQFMSNKNYIPDFISSHGHTIFHQPEIGLTVQIGNGATIAMLTGITTVCDFRTSDVAIGGQGAPLVPIGDELLFGEYNACLNLGGFSNISFCEFGERIAFDVSPCNMALNYLANQLNMPYDKDGKIARGGIVDKSLLENLNGIEYYCQKGAKSLGKEWFDKIFKPILDNSNICIENKLRTVTEHIAIQLAKSSYGKNEETMLVTGGGTRNKFLIERLSEISAKKIIIPDSETIDFKEAVIFAFLGVLRMRGEINCLNAVTGAKRNCCGGAVYLG